MSKRNDKLLLEDIVVSCNKILEYTKDMSFEQFLNDERTIDACIRNFEVIGEAANNVSEFVIQKNNHINWRQVIGFRNRLIHAYFGVDNEILWTIISENILILKNQIEEILK